jgi:hypothetical protein
VFIKSVLLSARLRFLYTVFIFIHLLYAQPSDYNFFSLGGRSTLSGFSHDGWGIGTGGQFRVELSKKVNTDWFADYIVVQNNPEIKSEYYHIGWSVLFYPFDKLQFPEYRFQPFVLAGHCFDYNKKSVVSRPSLSVDRWGSAVQGGFGGHLHINERTDLTLMAQYMIHLTEEVEIHKHDDGTYEPHHHASGGLEGHLLITLSMNYKIFKLWKRK